MFMNLFKIVKEYINNKPKIKKTIGIILMLIGLTALFTPLTPGSWLVLVGLELLGLRVLLSNKLLNFSRENNIMKKILYFFDKLEDNIRAALSRHSIIYAFIGGTAIVLFWRGVWMVADTIPFLTGPVSMLVSIAMLLAIGLFVSFFIGDTILISGLKKEKRLDEKVASEVKTELEILNDIQKRLNDIEKELKTLKEKWNNPDYGQ